MNKTIVVLLIVSALAWGGMTFLRSVRSKSSQVPAWVAQQKASKKHPQEVARALENLPKGIMRPDFCSWDRATANRHGGFELIGVMDLPIYRAGDRVNAFMKNTQWELYDTIKQPDAAGLVYNKDNVDVFYTFLLNSNAPNKCWISWRITERQ